MIRTRTFYALGSPVIYVTGLFIHVYCLFVNVVNIRVCVCVCVVFRCGRKIRSTLNRSWSPFDSLVSRSKLSVKN